SYFSTGGVFQFEKMAATFHSTKSSPKNIRNPRIDELIDKVPLTKDPVEKKKLALEAAVLSMNEYSTLAFLDLQTVFALSQKMGQITPTKGMVGLGPSFATVTLAK
ncbi:MAG: hypothetical protein Q7O66_01745, partial [Dehalococcoidia bacterium]|nr:hypothetical protein [Dehalococcoidia bacterium]